MVRKQAARLRADRDWNLSGTMLTIEMCWKSSENKYIREDVFMSCEPSIVHMESWYEAKSLAARNLVGTGGHGTVRIREQRLRYPVILKNDSASTDTPLVGVLLVGDMGNRLHLGRPSKNPGGK